MAYRGPALKGARFFKLPEQRAGGLPRVVR